MCKLAALALIALGTVIPSQLSTDPPPGAIWPVWRADGKGVGAYPLSLKEQSTILEHYSENVLRIHSDLNWATEHGKPFEPSPEVSLVGKWNNLKVYDVFEDKYQLKQIVVEMKSDSFRILYSLDGRDMGGVELTPSFIVTLNGMQVLITSCTLSGTTQQVETQFVFDSLTGKPTELVTSRAQPPYPGRTRNPPKQ